MLFRSHGFITGFLRTSSWHDSIMVVVDMLTKVTHFILVKNTYSNSDVAQVFIKYVVILHGVPKNIVSNRCKVHFQVLEGNVCRFSYRVGLQYNLSSVDGWEDIEGQQYIGGHVEDVCDASIEDMGAWRSTFHWFSFLIIVVIKSH